MLKHDDMCSTNIIRAKLAICKALNTPKIL